MGARLPACLCWLRSACDGQCRVLKFLAQSNGIHGKQPTGGATACAATTDIAIAQQEQNGDRMSGSSASDGLYLDNGPAEWRK